MIRETITYHCPHCDSPNIVRNGHNPKGKQQYRCHACGKSGVLNPSVPYTEAEKAQILTAYFERPSMRGIERLFGGTRQTLAGWLKKKRGDAKSVRDARARTPCGHLGSR